MEWPRRLTLNMQPSILKTAQGCSTAGPSVLDLAMMGLEHLWSFILEVLEKGGLNMAEACRTPWSCFRICWSNLLCGWLGLHLFQAACFVVRALSIRLLGQGVAIEFGKMHNFYICLRIDLCA